MIARSTATAPAMTAPSQRRWWLVTALIALVFAATLAVIVAAKRRAGTGFGELHGVRLGMTVRDVRARFDTAGVGSWESSPSDDMVLRWKPTADARGGALAAQFEFHMGILMAMRADLSPGDIAAKGLPFELSDSTVVVREPTPSGQVHLTVIARSCPTHEKEAARLVRERAE